MIYKCRACQQTEGRGFLPGVSCGLMIMGLAGVAGGLLFSLLRFCTTSLGWWWVLAAPLLLVASFFGAWLLHGLLAGIEWLLFCFRRCPNCRSRRWSWGFTQGFGL